MYSLLSYFGLSWGASEAQSDDACRVKEIVDNFESLSRDKCSWKSEECLAPLKCARGRYASAEFVKEHVGKVKPMVLGRPVATQEERESAKVASETAREESANYNTRLPDIWGKYSSSDYLLELKFGRQLNFELVHLRSPSSEHFAKALRDARAKIIEKTNLIAKNCGPAHARNIPKYSGVSAVCSHMVTPEELSEKIRSLRRVERTERETNPLTGSVCFGIESTCLEKDESGRSHVVQCDNVKQRERRELMDAIKSLRVQYE